MNHFGMPSQAMQSTETLAGGQRVGAIEMAMSSLSTEAKSVLHMHSELWKRLQKVSRQEPAANAVDKDRELSTGCQHADDLMEVVLMLQVLKSGLEYQLRVLEV